MRIGNIVNGVNIDVYQDLESGILKGRALQDNEGVEFKATMPAL